MLEEVDEDLAPDDLDVQQLHDLQKAVDVGRCIGDDEEVPLTVRNHAPPRGDERAQQTGQLRDRTRPDRHDLGDDLVARASGVREPADNRRDGALPCSFD